MVPEVKILQVHWSPWTSQVLADARSRWIRASNGVSSLSTSHRKACTRLTTSLKAGLEPSTFASRTQWISLRKKYDVQPSDKTERLASFAERTYWDLDIGIEARRWILEAMRTFDIFSNHSQRIDDYASRCAWIPHSGWPTWPRNRRSDRITLGRTKTSSDTFLFFVTKQKHEGYIHFFCDS